MIRDVIMRERRFYMPSEKLKSVSEYSDGLKSGPEIIYDEETSRVIQTQSYLKGILNGYKSTYDRITGEMLTKTMMLNGEIAFTVTIPPKIPTESSVYSTEYQSK
jgi:hypothetical protein